MADHALPSDPAGAFVVGPALLAGGRPGGPLEGRRFAVKDLVDVAGTRTGAGNPDFLADAPVAERSAPVVEALVEAGASLWGKTVTDELAFSLSGTNVHYGTPRNAAAPGRIPGGSSAGSAAAVAAGLVELSVGTDTAGSVRVPASYCGLFGLRPTHGRIDDTGVQPLAPSFDTVGIFAADPAVLAAAWTALRAGAPGPAATSVGASERAADLSAFVPPPTPARRLVVADDLLALADPDAVPLLVAAAERLAESVGAELVHGQLAGAATLVAWRDAFRAMQLVEAWATHGAFVERRQPRLGPGIAARLAAAAAADPVAAEAARPRRGEVVAALGDLLGDDGILVHPAATGPAPPPDLPAGAKDDLRARTFLLTAPAGLAGSPVVALPLARTADGLPLGLACAGRPGDDERLLDLARLARRPA